MSVSPTIDTDFKKSETSRKDQRRNLLGTRSSHFCLVSFLKKSSGFSGANPGSGLKVTICCATEN